jgi:hypothetical protein
MSTPHVLSDAVRAARRKNASEGFAIRRVKVPSCSEMIKELHICMVIAVV